jgi:hypothetical protein
MVEQFKYLATTLMNQNSIQEEVKSRLKSRNACYHSVQNLLSFSLQSKNLKIKIYRSIILLVVLSGCETWSPTLRGETAVCGVWLGGLQVPKSSVPAIHPARPRRQPTSHPFTQHICITRF